jgi:hypothetical protein
MTNHMQPGVPVRVHDAATYDDLGIVHVPFPVEIGDELAIDGHQWPFVIVDLLETAAGSAVAAIVTVDRATLHEV